MACDGLQPPQNGGSAAAEKEAAGRRATDAPVLEDAERLIAAWNERQAKRMPMLFSSTKPRLPASLWLQCMHDNIGQL
jgi:hypothetical protein